MINNDERKAPVLRFKGFTNDWEQRKLGDIAKIVRGASPRPIKDSKWFDKNSNIGWLRISDVTKQHGKIYHLEQHISKLGQKKTRVIESPHLLLSIAASVGYPVINYIPTGVHDGFLIFKNPKFNIQFGFFWLEQYQKQWKKYGQPGSQVNLNSSIVENTKIRLPDKQEQKEVIKLLNKIEQQILLQQRKIKLLKILYSSLIKQSINKKPKIYFNKEIIENRISVTLKEILNYKNGKGHEKQQSPKGKYELINLNSVSIDGKIKDSGKYINSSNELLKKNDIVIVLSDIAHGKLIGQSAVIPRDNYYVLNQRVALLRPKRNDNSVYLSNYINNYHNYFKKVAAGMSQINISKKDVENFEFIIPTLKTQNFLGDFIKKLNQIMDNDVKKLNYLNKLKQFLLQNMFI